MFKKCGQTHLALANFSWALDLDPKGANNQIKEALDKRYLPDDDDPTAEALAERAPSDAGKYRKKKFQKFSRLQDFFLKP